MCVLCEDDVDGFKVDELKDVLWMMVLLVSGWKVDFVVWVKEVLAARGEGEGEDEDEDEDVMVMIEVVVEVMVEGCVVEEVEVMFVEVCEEGGVVEMVMETRADVASAETAASVERRASVVEGWDEVCVLMLGMVFWNVMLWVMRVDV